MSVQVEDVDSKFSGLAELEGRGWKEAAVVVVPAARKPAVAPRKHQPTAVKKPAASGSRLLMYSNTVPVVYLWLSIKTNFLGL